MSFVSGIELIKMAEKANTSVIAFNCLDYNMVASVIAAAERVKKPAMIMLLPEHATKNKVTTFEAFGAMVKAMAEKATVPIALHLDHCYDEEEIKRAIDAGFTSVMYDASQYDLDENIRRTKAVVWYAHSKGVMVEAELGSVGLAKNNDNEKEDFSTKPEAVKKFTEATGVDALAIAIGNAHGDYPFPPTLDLQRLDEINAVTDVPLVLHGGSGIPEDQLAEAFSRGINKFNYGTDTMHCYNDAVLAYHKACEPAGSNDMIGEAEYVQKEITDFLAKKLDLVKL